MSRKQTIQRLEMYQKPVFTCVDGVLFVFRPIKRYYCPKLLTRVIVNEATEYVNGYILVVTSTIVHYIQCSKTANKQNEYASE
jgi:hypothetical protein